VNRGLLVLGAALFVVRSAEAQRDTTRADSTRPFVRGGIHDKPFLDRLSGRIAIGGYAEAHVRYTRVDGLREESGIVPKRFNLFTNTRVSPVVRFGAELEFEDGTNEIKLEYSAVDQTLHRLLTLRGGMILSPLGRFNLSHDSPLNEFTDRPLVSTELLGVALSEAGVGILGEVGAGADGRVTYEAYATNGFHDGLVLQSPDGTRLPLGRGNVEDNNGSPALVGRLAWSPRAGFELGVSGHHGAYNVFEEDGVRLDERRNVSVAVIDVEAEVFGARVFGEGATARIELPNDLRGLFAGRQRGAFLEIVRPVARGIQPGLPNSVIALKARVDYVDFDTSVPGDGVLQLSAGVNYRPTPDTVLKFDYVRGRSRDRFNTAAEHAKLLASIATYF
jgi:hypothetical protein